MKLSTFNVTREIGGHTVVYNTQSGGVLKLNPDYAQALAEFSTTGRCPRADLLSELERGSMAIQDDDDEVESLRARSLASRFNSNALGLTIAPTLECNFACVYCYEEGYRRNTMSDAVQEQVVEFVKKYIPFIFHLSINWYGGEPLLALNRIDSLTRAFLELTGEQIGYSADVVTNGYLLNRENARRLRELKVRQVQVTLDGPPDAHNSRRHLVGGQGTFDRIMSNIKEACDEVQLLIRVNVDRTNVGAMDRFLDEMEAAGIKKKVPFYFAPVDNINETCGPLASSCLSIQEFSVEEVALYRHALDRGFDRIFLPMQNPSICGAVSLNSFIIDPLGDLYKCWDNIGQTEEKVGDVVNGPRMAGKLARWLAYNPADHPECEACPVLPACMGGCPYQKLKSGTHRCMPIRYNAPASLDLFHRAKQQADTPAASE